MTIREYGNRGASHVLIQPVDEHEQALLDREYEMIRELTGEEFYMMTVKVEDWNRDLSPWKAGAVFGKEDFAGGAEETLTEILKLTDDNKKSYIIGGYSLAGLFALWTAYRTDVFSGVAAASPSVWFPGFLEYMKSREILADIVYLSLGNREEKTRNPRMAMVGTCIREGYARLKGSGVCSILEWNTGNHFQDVDRRTAKAFAWVLQAQKAQ